MLPAVHYLTTPPFYLHPGCHASPLFLVQCQEHRKACNTASPHTCVPCGITQPSARHLDLHLAAPKHAAQEAWLQTLAPASAAIAAPAPSAAAAATPPSAKQAPKQPQLAPPSALPQPQPKAALPPQQPAAQQQQQAAQQVQQQAPVQRQPAAELPMGYVSGCGVCGVTDRLPAAHFAVSIGHMQHNVMYMLAGSVLPAASTCLVGSSGYVCSPG